MNQLFIHFQMDRSFQKTFLEVVGDWIVPKPHAQKSLLEILSFY